LLIVFGVVFTILELVYKRAFVESVIELPTTELPTRLPEITLPFEEIELIANELGTRL
jgi:hypothetical protein